MGIAAAKTIAFIAFLLASVLVFPPGSASSGVYYTSLSFFMIALFLSSLGKGFPYGISYLRLVPKSREVPSLALQGIAALLLSITVAVLSSVLLGWLGFLDAELVGQKIVQLPAVSLVLAFSLAPIGEEALFRGYLFRKISEASGSWALGALLSSAVFAAMHVLYGSVAEIAVAFLIALVFCAFTQRAKSLLPAILAHSLFNFISIISTVFL
ncbi:CAAX protease self-immunity [uncultured archaeon]|nr:CAAX protease self-immunity [uncultured archaeon]